VAGGDCSQVEGFYFFIFIFTLLFNFHFKGFLFADCVFSQCVTEITDLLGFSCQKLLSWRGLLYVWVECMCVCANMYKTWDMCTFVRVCKDWRINMLCIRMHPPTHVDVRMYFSNCECLCVHAHVYLCWWHVDRETKGWGGLMLQYFFLPLP